MTKTNFVDGDPSQGILGTIVPADYLNKVNHQVPTGEDLDGSVPVLYGVDTGSVNAYVLNLVFGKKRREGTNTGTSANKLIDSGAGFQTAGVAAGDVVLNVSDHTSATVVTVDSQTQLTLSGDIFIAIGKRYAVGPSIQQLPQALMEGLTISFKAVNTNTGGSTININGLGSKTIKKNVSTDLVAGDIQAGQTITLVYDGVNFQMCCSPGKVSSAATADSLTMNGEASAKSVSNAYVNLDLGSVTSGDRILVNCYTATDWSVAPSGLQGFLTKGSGTATIQMLDDLSSVYWPIKIGGLTTYYGYASIVVKVTGTGTLTLEVATGAGGGTLSSSNTQIYAFFLKKG